MARIPGRPKKGAPPAVRAAYAAAPRSFAKMVGRRVDEVPEPLTLHAYAPAIMAANSGFELALMRSTRVPLTLKELARARAGMLVGCRW
jgi:hypothetical protein